MAIIEQPGYAQLPPPGYDEVITKQPGVAIPAAPGISWMPSPPIISGVPNGLEYLAHTKALLEILTNWETRNKYIIKNASDQQVYFAFEESGCCERQFCGSERSFIMHIIDNYKKEVLTIRRDFKCCGGCCGMTCVKCCQQECIIESPSAGLLGVVRQRTSSCSSNFNVYDADDQLLFKIDGPCHCMLIGCQDKEFPIFTLNRVMIGAISKRWGGICREMYTDSDIFAVNFPMDLDVRLKGVLLGATFLIDFMEFENNHVKKAN